MVFSKLLKWAIEAYFKIKIEKFSANILDRSVHFEGIGLTKEISLISSCQLISCNAESICACITRGSRGRLEATVSHLRFSLQVKDFDILTQSMKNLQCLSPDISYLSLFLSQYFFQALGSFDCTFRDISIDIAGRGKQTISIAHACLSREVPCGTAKVHFSDISITSRNAIVGDVKVHVAQWATTVSNEKYASCIKKMKIMSSELGAIILPSAKFVIAKTLMAVNVRSLSINILDSARALNEISKYTPVAKLDHWSFMKKKLLVFIGCFRLSCGASEAIFEKIFAAHSKALSVIYCRKALYESSYVQNCLLQHTPVKASRFNRPRCFIEQFYLSKEGASVVAEQSNQLSENLQKILPTRCLLSEVDYKVLHLHLVD